MSATTTDKKIIINALPLAWIYKITGGALAALWKFDNLQSGSINIKLPSEAANSSDNLDINRADGGIIRFAKNSIIVAGKDESSVTDPTKNPDATNRCEVDLITNEAPGPTTLNSWTAFVKDVVDNMDSKFLIVVPMGVSYESWNASSYKADGYCYMLGKFSAGVTQQLQGQPASLDLKFTSYKDATIDATDLTGITFDAIALKLGGSTKSFTPPALVSGDTAAVLAGLPVLKSDYTYSFS